MYDVIGKEFMFSNPLLWVDLAVSVLLVGVSCFIFAKTFKTTIGKVNLVILLGLMFVSWFFGLKFVWAITVALYGAVVAIFFITNGKSIGKIAFSKNRNKGGAERIYDRELVTQKVSIAVENLSRTKTGALITFEMGDKFNDIVKSGTMVESPISPELLVTIFYPGTRLHDGAVVIRKDEILAASVYYSPTTKPLTGKYGSRHRAAIGISEVTDSVTVVVSEETGRISIAYKGELIPVSQDKLLTTLQEYLMGERAE